MRASARWRTQSAMSDTCIRWMGDAKIVTVICPACGRWMCECSVRAGARSSLAGWEGSVTSVPPAKHWHLRIACCARHLQSASPRYQWYPTSARVGVGSVCMDCSRCEATMTGLPSRRHLVTTSFCAGWSECGVGWAQPTSAGQGGRNAVVHTMFPNDSALLGSSAPACLHAGTAAAACSLGAR